MYKGFKLSQINFNNDLDYYFNIGNQIYNNYKQRVRSSLKSYFLEDKSLDGTQIIKDWFPQVDSHVFLSHSHQDETMVIALAGWLYDKFNIITFIDSCIWGYSNDLNKIIDDEYSWSDRTNNLYDYQKVMNSTSHVHMMLSTALGNMIDKTECLIFYDTPNSIKPYANTSKTESPWIYSEIAYTKILRQNIPTRIVQLVREERQFSAFEGANYIEKSLKIKYDISSKHLVSISANTFQKWSAHFYLNDPEQALDKLYEIALPVTIDLNNLSNG